MRPVLLLLVPALFLGGCASLPLPASSKPGKTQTLPQLNSPASLATPTASTAEPSLAPSETFTPTLSPFVPQFTAIPTETPLPTLELPTLRANAPPLVAWDGIPTYLADSKPGYYFRLRFDPALWALTTDNFGLPALAHRSIPNCLISPSSGRGLPLNGTVDHEVRRVGIVKYQVNTAYVNGVKQFVTYSAGDGNIFTAFEVTFQDQPDQCLTDAEAVLAELTSISITLATPVATP